MSRIYLPIKWVACAALVLCPLFARNPPQPEFISPDFDAESLGEIVVLSMVDHRIGVEPEPKLDKWVGKIIEISLKKARYDFSFATSPEYIEAVTRDGLEDEDPEMIAKLGPEGSRWLLLLELHDASSRLSLGSAGGAEMTGYIIDKENRSVIWRNKEFTEARQGGLMGVAMKGTMKISAIQMAAGAILKILPKKAKTKKKKKN